MARRLRPMVVIACVLLGFLAALVLRSRPASPESRVPRRYQLAALIERQRRTSANLQGQVEELRKEIDDLRSHGAGQQQGSAALEAQLTDAGLTAGLSAMRGAGLKVTLDDSRIDRAPSGNVNDLVVHSQDVQAVVNALWQAGAEAVAINGQRLVGTSAVLCVGNTLLLNGSVHSPPYEVTALGASREVFETDSLVRRLHSDASTFGLRFSVDAEDRLRVPAYAGVATTRYARPTTAG
jgi:uncharacterized protein YlxW (UPF0749 family)